MNYTINLLHLTLPANQTTMFFFQNLTAELLYFESPDDSYFPKSGGSSFLKTVGSHFSEICANKITAYTILLGRLR